MKKLAKVFTLVLSAALATSVALFAGSCGENDDTPQGDGSQNTPNTPTTYSVTYSLGSCDSLPYGGTTALPTEAAKEAGAKFSLPAAPVWSGYTFKGWSDGSHVYQAGAEFTMPASAVTLTATWEKVSTPGPDTPTTYDVTFSLGKCEDENYAGTTALPTETAKEAGAKFSLPAAPVWSGYTFKGWSDGSHVYQAGAEFTMPASAVTLTATWEKDAAQGPTELKPASGTGTKADPYILNAFEGTLHLELPSCANSNEYVYIQYTATESGIYKATYENDNDLGFNLTKSGSSFSVAVWSLKSESYPFPLTQGTVYTLRLCGNQNDAVDLSITFEKVALSIPADYVGTWADAEENPTYTLEIGENNSVKLNGTAVTELNLAEFNGGFTFKWDNKNCTMSYVGVGLFNPVACILVDIGEDEITFYKEGHFPAPPAEGTEENPEVIEQSDFAKAYNVDLQGTFSHYFTITPTQTKTYTLTTTISYLNLEITDEEGEHVVNWSNSKEVKSIVFELKANNTYTLFVSDSDSDGMTSTHDVTFTIEEGGEVPSAEISAQLVGTWKSANGKATLVLTANTFEMTTVFLEGQPPTVVSGVFKSARSDGEGTYAIVGINPVTGQEFPMSYDIKTHVFTYASYELTKEGETSNTAQLAEAWKAVWETGEEADPSYLLDLSGDYVVFAESGTYFIVGNVTYTAAENKLSFTVDSIAGATTYTFVLNADEGTLALTTSDEGTASLKKSVAAMLPKDLDGHYAGVDENMGGQVSVDILGTDVLVTIGEGDEAQEVTGKITAYDADTKTLTVDVDDMGPVEFVYDPSAGSLTANLSGDGEATFTKSDFTPWPSELTGTWTGDVAYGPFACELTLHLDKEITVDVASNGNEPENYTATFVSWDADSKTLVLHINDAYDADVSFVWNDADNTLSCTYGGDDYTLTKQGGEVSEDIPEDWWDVWVSVDDSGDVTDEFKLDLTGGDVVLHSDGTPVDITSWSFKDGVLTIVEEYVFNDNPMTNTYLFTKEGDTVKLYHETLGDKYPVSLIKESAVPVSLPEDLCGTSWTHVEVVSNEDEGTKSANYEKIFIGDETYVSYTSSTGDEWEGEVTSYDEVTGILKVNFSGNVATLTWNSATRQMTVLLGSDVEPIVFNQLVIPETLTGEFASVASEGFGSGFTKMEFGVGGDASAVRYTIPGPGGNDTVYVGNVVSVEKHEGGVDGSVISYTVLVVLNSTGDEEDITQQVFEFDFTSTGVLQVYEDRGGDYLEVVMAFYHVLDEMPEAFYGNWTAQVDGNEVTIVIDKQGATIDGLFTNPEVVLITPSFFVVTDDPDAPMSTQYTFEYTARPESFTTNAGKNADEVKFYKAGSQNAPFKWSSVAGAHDVELPDPDLNLPVYIEFTADKDAIYLVSYSNSFKDMQFTLTEKVSGTRVASWSVKDRPSDAPDGIYPFPLKNGVTYVLKLLNGNAAGTLSITFTETTDIPADYIGTWTDKAADPTYTVTVEANKITVNNTEITTYTVGNADSGWTFTWDGKDCSIKYIQQLSAGTETYKEHLEFTVDGGKAVSLYQEGDHPAVAAVGSLKNPEFVGQDALANSYSKEVASGAKYYYAVEATENVLYQLTTTVDNLKITIANLEDDGNYAVGDQKIVNLADTTATKSVYFELVAGTTYVIVVENADAATSGTVSFTIENADNAEDDSLVPKSLRTTFVGKTDKALTFTFTALTWQAYTPAVLSGMAPTKWTGSVKSVVDSDASTVISLVAASTGSEFSATYDKTTKELTFTYSGGKTVVYASESEGGSVEAWEGELPTIWEGTWYQKDFGAPKANQVVIAGNEITITINGVEGVDNLTVVITDYDAEGMVISFSSEDGSVTGTIERQFTWDTEEITCIKITVNGQLRQQLRPQA